MRLESILFPTCGPQELSWEVLALFTQSASYYYPVNVLNRVGRSPFFLPGAQEWE